MKLLELYYKNSDWELDNLQLGNVNLIVGKNATGKTRTLATINILCNIILQKRALGWGVIWKFKLTNDKGDIVSYEFSTDEKSQSILTESLYINERLMLKRENGDEANIKSVITLKKSTFNPPQDKLTMHVRRDVKEYPFLEEIVYWAEQAIRLDFANIGPTMVFNLKEKNSLSSAHGIAVLFSNLHQKSRNLIIEELNEIGYSIEKLNVQKRDNYKILFIKEKSIENDISLRQVSQGMFRAISTIIFFEYVLGRKNPTTFIIDDLCEGLDYERATKLGKLIFNKCENSRVQLIATSNDSFLMDVVDIKYWNVLYRNGNIVKALNYLTNKELFQKFKYTGLSNFDFFASDYIKQKANL